MKTFFLLSYFLLATTVFSQDVISVSKSMDFRIIPSMHNNSNRLINGYFPSSPLESYYNNYDQAKVYAPDGSVYVLAQSRTKQGQVVLLSPDLSIKWEVPIDGVGLALASFNGNILLIHAPILNKKNYKDYEYSATLIDKVTGKTLLTKTILSHENDYSSDAKFFIDPNGKWLLVGSRKTNVTQRITRSGFAEKFDATQEFTITRINEKLEPAQKYTLTGDFLSTGFVGSGANAQGDIFVCSYAEDKIQVEKFSIKDNYGKAQILSHNISLRKKGEIVPLFYVDATQLNDVFLSFRFENSEKDIEHKFIRFDFDRKKAFAFSEMYDKAQRTEYEMAAINSVNKDLRKPAFSISKLEPTQILRWKDKTILLKETNDMGMMGGGKNPDFYYISDDLIVQVFSNDNKLLKTFLIPKFFHPNWRLGLRSGAFIKDNFLYTISSDSKNIFIGGKTTTLIGKFDLNKLIPVAAYWVKRKDMSDKWSATEGGSTLLFKDGFAISQLTPSYKAFKGEVDIQFQKLGY